MVSKVALDVKDRVLAVEQEWVEAVVGADSVSRMPCSSFVKDRVL